ncbi:class I adenylate-forming enzyme family protein [Intrasporangium calvum]|uniref:class I adenylate-forming enzyme family protein n=1 Tax=Intrasporangium calvum TaxID=53358 RepID=UPI000DF5F528|nr:AMP-binding protein [Intrasporangium calvum]AXG14384.1 o-succinylbenzoate--CoA ligase [Intrasporangium calvum]
MPSLAQVLSRTATRVPDRIAVQFGSTSLTYAALERRVNQLARELTDRGLRHGDRLLLLSGNSDAFVIALYAGLRLGAIVVPVNPRSAPPEVDHFVTDSGARLLLFGPELVANVRGWQAQHEGAGGIPALALGEAAGFDDVLTAASAQPDDPLDVEVAEDDDALIIYTSGTTGRPKGALFDQHRILWVGINTALGLGLHEGERMLHVAPLYHSASLDMLLIGGMMYGATHVILPGFDPETVLETIERERSTFFFGVPTMYTFLLRTPSIASRDLSSLRVCMYGAAPMPATTAEALVAALPGASIIQACGQTEGGPGGILLQHDEVLERPSASGRSAVPNTEVRIIDLEGNDVAPGAVGEMIMRGETMMKGYWGKPEVTAETVRDGWVHTGDLASVDEDGYITLVDRLKDLIITGGRNVYSAEVESALAGHPAVGDIAVVGRPDDEYGEKVVAVVTPRDGAELTLADLREYGARHLSSYKLPRELVIAEIPRNPSGKILKHRIREKLHG